MKLVFTLLLSWVIGISVSCQDYIITWQGDTISCRFPDNPRKEGFRPVKKYLNAHNRLAAVFSNDSVRIIEAGQVKGYYRSRHGQSFLCNGDFVAKKIIYQNTRGAAKPRRNAPDDEGWFFLRKVEEGAFASLYILYKWRGGSRPYLFYCISKHEYGDPLVSVVMKSKNNIIRFLSDPKIDFKNRKFRNNTKGYQEIVKEYNRLKEASKNQ